MKSFAILSTLAASVLAVSIPANTANYDGYKVVRIPTQENNYAKVVDVIKSLNLSTWKFPKAAGSNADIVIPPQQLSEFNKAIAGLKTEIMHEDLGLSMGNEVSQSGIYTSMSIRRSSI